ncbi:hypothetical protein COBT_002530 [Conglomerata obtusa]
MFSYLIFLNFKFQARASTEKNTNSKLHETSNNPLYTHNDNNLPLDKTHDHQENFCDNTKFELLEMIKAQKFIQYDSTNMKSIDNGHFDASLDRNRSLPPKIVDAIIKKDILKKADRQLSFLYEHDSYSKNLDDVFNFIEQNGLTDEHTPDRVVFLLNDC